jgi:hypothetical protein
VSCLRPLTLVFEKFVSAPQVNAYSSEKRNANGNAIDQKLLEGTLDLDEAREFIEEWLDQELELED